MGMRQPNSTEANTTGSVGALGYQGDLEKTLHKIPLIQDEAEEVRTNPPTIVTTKEDPSVHNVKPHPPATEFNELPSPDKSEKKVEKIEVQCDATSVTISESTAQEKDFTKEISNGGKESPLTSGSTFVEAESYENLSKVQTIAHLEEGFYDVVVFCLLLEYIPSPKQRHLCCQKAYNLLRLNGILCIITPDSKHQNANVHLYKLWKITLGYLGFSRTKYEKRTHFHGMVFRKGLCKEAWKLDADRELSVMKKTNVRNKYIGINYNKINGEIYIPQDFQDISESEEEGS